MLGASPTPTIGPIDLGLGTGPVDLPARIIVVLGLLVAIAAVILTYYLWHRSGPDLKVNAFVRPETGSIRIDVISTAMVRHIGLRDRVVITIPTGQGDSRTSSFHRWAMNVAPYGEPLPRNVAPTAYLEADVYAKRGDEQSRRRIRADRSGLGSTRRWSLVLLQAA